MSILRIAIIMPVFNVAPFLQQAILSVLHQTQADWSLTVVDDGSTDTTADVAQRHADNRICLIRQPNGGVSAARNRGIASYPQPCAAGRSSVTESKSAIQDAEPCRQAAACIDPHRMSVAKPRSAQPDAFLFLDGDDWLAPNALAVLARTLEGAPWAIAACGRYARVAMNGAARVSSPMPQGCLLERLLTRNLFANGGHLLIRREAIEAAGGFRQDLSYGEDWEYWTRLALLGRFVAVRSRLPLLFVRERVGSACLSRATDPEANHAALAAIYHNPAIRHRLGDKRLHWLQRRAAAETAWTVGRELIRHGYSRDGRRWLGHSIGKAPSVKRLALIGLSWLRSGPFRRYENAGQQLSRSRHRD